jgi:LPS-assembly protein
MKRYGLARIVFIRFLLLTGVLFLPFSSPSFAQETQQEEQEEEKEIPIVCHGDTVEFTEGKQKLSAVGNVLVLYKDFKINCDRIEIALDTKDALAEGNIVFYQKGSVLTGDKAEYNFDTERGVIYKAGFASQLIYGKGPLAVKEGPDKMTMDNSYMTTCDLAGPHYRIQSRSVKIFLGDKVVMRHVIVYIGEIPIIYLPYYSYSLKPDQDRVSFFPGKDKDWGYYLLSTWRYELHPCLKGILRLDYREKRDFASGFDNYYETVNFGKGFVKAYYMNERELLSKKLWKEPRITRERERYMLQHRHSWDMDADTDLRFQYWTLSDTNLLQDYFYKNEYLRGANTESYLSIIRSMPNYNASLLAKRRFNKIFERVEYQPELKFNIPNIRILGGDDTKGDSSLYWSSENSFANISKKIAHPSDQDEDTVRFDTYNRLSYSSELGFLHLTPYAGARETFYTKDINGDRNWWRHIFYTGASLDTKFYRIFNVNSDFLDLDINNLRHVITPTVGYGYVRTPTILPEKLVQFDGLDSLDKSNSFTFSLENKLQTKRSVTGEDEKENFTSVDLAKLLVSTSYDYRRSDGSRFNNVNFDFEFTPFNWLTLEFDTAYDHRQDRFSTFKLDLYANKTDKLELGAGYHYGHDAHSVVTTEVSFKPTPLWKLSVYESFMFKGYPDSKKKINALNVQEYRIVRDLHCWTSEIIYNVTRARGESLYFVFRLKGFPELPLEFGTEYHRPKQ